MRIKKIKDDMNQNLNDEGESNLVELLKNSQKKKTPSLSRRMVRSQQG